MVVKDRDILEMLFIWKLPKIRPQKKVLNTLPTSMPQFSKIFRHSFPNISLTLNSFTKGLVFQWGTQITYS